MNKQTSRASCLPSDRIPWRMALITLLCAAFLPEYIAPVFTLSTFLVFKRYFSQTKQKARIGTVGKVFLVYMCYMMISFLWSDTKIFSILVPLLWMGMFLGDIFLSNLIDRRERLRQAMFFLTIGAAAVSVVALLQMLCIKLKIPFPIPFWKDVDHFIFKFLPFSIVTDFVSTRASATFDNPLILAAYLIIILPVSIYSLFELKEKWQRITAGVCVLLIFGGIAATYSRGAYLAVIVMLVVLMFLGKKQAVGIAALFAGILLILPQSVYQRLFAILQLDVSTVTRLAIWGGCLKVFTENPLFGVGAGTENVTNLLQNRFGINQPHAHSLYFELLVEGGLISILFFVAVLSLLVYDLFYLLRSGRKWRRMGVAYLASLAGFLVFSVFEFSLQTPKELQYFMLFLGLVEASKRLCQKSMAEQNISPKPLEETPPAVKEESPCIVRIYLTETIV
ncbi:MAG: O-antigen ligase family protein [Acutalibacteraceae bacterium]